jgi:hypothetical protein
MELQIEVNILKLKELEREYQFFLINRSGSFTTHLFKAFIHADRGNFLRLAEAFPEHGYIIAQRFRNEFLDKFTLV